MKLTSLLIIFIFLTNLSYSQNAIFLSRKYPDSIYYQQIAKVQKYLAKDTLNKPYLAHHIASAYHRLYERGESSYLDSVYLYIGKAVTYDKAYCCQRFEQIDISIKGLSPSTKIKRAYTGLTTYFVRDLMPEFLDSFLLVCHQTPNLLEPKEIEIIKDSSYFKLLEEINVRDQKYREFEPFSQALFEAYQPLLDYRNRIVMDSIFKVKGFPTNQLVTKKGTDNALLVLHHSTDCEWNEKWIQFFLDTFQKDEITGSFLFQTIKRFYHPKTGFCEYEKSKKFIQHLKEKYPKEYGDTFGYNAY